MYGTTSYKQIESFLALHDLSARSGTDKFSTAYKDGYLDLSYTNNENHVTVIADLKTHMRSMCANEEREFFIDIMSAFNYVSVQPEQVREFLNKQPNLKATANSQVFLCDTSKF